jgi:hypothetical protein
MRVYVGAAQAERRTNAVWAHARSLCVDLVHVCQSPRERIGRDLVAVLVPVIGRLDLRAHNLRLGVRYTRLSATGSTKST